MKSRRTAILLSIFFGPIGVDRFYLGYVGLGLLKVFTFGCCGVLALVDLIRICTGSLRPADGSPYEGEVDPDPETQNVGAKLNEYVSSMERITALHNSGALSDEEFARQRSEILAKL